jgi:hypothetical protein
MIKKIGARDYIESSSYKTLNMKEVFEATLKIALNSP